MTSSPAPEDRAFAPIRKPGEIAPMTPSPAGREAARPEIVRAARIILIVEDDTFWRRWYIETLGEHYGLRFAGDARTAIQRVASTRPAAIICDRHINPIPRSAAVPDETVSQIDRRLAEQSYVDGWQFLRQVRKSVFRDIPIILVTDDGPGGMNWVRQKLLHPDGFITKGRITPDDLLALLRRLIERTAEYGS